MMGPTKKHFKTQGSIILFSLSTLWLVVSGGIAVYLAEVLLRKTGPGMGGEALNQSLGFVLDFTIALGLLGLLVIFLPSVYRHRRASHRRDLLSVKLSGLSLIILLLAFLIAAGNS